jgi:thiol-disulfide isomerase/thioredoxin
VRTDTELAGGAFRASSAWKKDEIGGNSDEQIDNRLETGDEMIDGKLVVHSLSGHERNHFFLNGKAGQKFTDLSALSGLDSDSDSRGFVVTDYDRDGWQDVALVNSNQPLMQLFHNEIGELASAEKGLIAIRLIGGNKSASSSEWSNRDGYGALVEVTLPDGKVLKREHRCGEGYAAQNSRTMIVGIGAASRVSRVMVRWPSGRTSTVHDIVEGLLITISEAGEEGEFAQEPYRRKIPGADVPATRRDRFPLSRTIPGKIQVYTTMATWCPSCRKHLPGLAALQDERVALFAVPIDPEDDDEKLTAYVAGSSPSYEILMGVKVQEKKLVHQFLAAALAVENPVLPSSVITDGEGNVLEVMPGIPTLSHVRKWMER